MLLTVLAEGGPAPARQPEVAAALRLLDVRVACVASGDVPGAGVLAASGYSRLDSPTASWCFVAAS
jgi:hypothetical protein